MAREFTRVLKAVLQPQHYVSLLNSHIYVDWMQFFGRRYVLGTGTYPYQCRVRAPTGIVSLTVYCPEDCFTVNEIFGLHCYRADAQRIFVDFGANIGISAAYFLSRNSDAYVHCFEPLPENSEKLRRNLAAFDGRFSLREVAVADFDGELSFRVERTGRYSGIDNLNGELRHFPCVDANAVLGDILQQHGRIDFLKIDVEGAEALFVPKLDPRILECVDVVCIEGKDVLDSSRFELTKSVSGVLRYSRLADRCERTSEARPRTVA
jgi:FkbM family methyltransferase